MDKALGMSRGAYRVDAAYAVDRDAIPAAKTVQCLSIKSFS